MLFWQLKANKRLNKINFGMRFPSKWVNFTNHMCMCQSIGVVWSMSQLLVNIMPTKTHLWTNQAKMGRMESKKPGEHY